MTCDFSKYNCNLSIVNYQENSTSITYKNFVLGEITSLDTKHTVNLLNNCAPITISSSFNSNFSSEDFELCFDALPNNETMMLLKIKPLEFQFVLFRFTTSEELLSWLQLPFVFHTKITGYSVNVGITFFSILYKALTHNNGRWFFPEEDAVQLFDVINQKWIKPWDINKATLIKIMVLIKAYEKQCNNFSLCNTALSCLSHKLSIHEVYLLNIETELYTYI